MPLSEARTLLLTPLDNINSLNSQDITLIYPNQDYDITAIPNKTFVRININITSSESLVLGDKIPAQSFGVLSFQIYAPKDTGMAISDEIVEGLQNIYNGSRFSDSNNTIELDRGQILSTQLDAFYLREFNVNFTWLEQE